jgi:hypothetical protein
VAIVVRPVTEGDLGALAALERQQLARYPDRELVSAASLRFYGRSGHAFVAERSARTVGFALGRTGWDGARATVSVERLAAEKGEREALVALLAAVTKSAYDAGVYRIELRVASADSGTLALADSNDFRTESIALLTRTLGTGGG